MLSNKANSEILSGINSNQVITNEKLDDVNDNLGDIADKQDDTNDKLDDLGDKQDDTNEKLDDLGDKQDDTNEKLDDLGDKQDDTNEKLDDLGDKQDDTNEMLGDITDDKYVSPDDSTLNDYNSAEDGLLEDTEAGAEEMSNIFNNFGTTLSTFAEGIMAATAIFGVFAEIPEFYGILFVSLGIGILTFLFGVGQIGLSTAQEYSRAHPYSPLMSPDGGRHKDYSADEKWLL